MAGLLGFGAPNTTYNSQIPTIAGLYAQTSCYGVPKPILYGRNKLSGNVIFLGNLTTYDASAGVGKGGGSVQSTGYRAAIQLAMCEGPLSTVNFPTGIGRIWNGQTLMGAVDAAELPPDYPAVMASPFETVLIGTRPQDPWSYFGAQRSGQKVAGRNWAYTTSRTQLENGTGPAVSNFIQYDGGNTYTITDPNCIGIGMVQVVWKNGRYVTGTIDSGGRYLDLVTSLTPSTTNPPPAGSYYVSGTGASTVVVCSLPNSNYTTGTVSISYYVGVDLSYASLAYPGTAILCAQSLDLGTAGAVPQYAVEADGFLVNPANAAMGARDAAPGAIIADLLGNQEYGAGWGVAPWDVVAQRIDVVNGNTPIGDTAACGFTRYCRAMDFWLSPLIVSQKPALDHIGEILESTNSSCIWTAGPDGRHGMLKIVPLGDVSVTGNGVTYSPNVTPVYDLAQDSFLVEPGEAPIQMDLESVSDTWNRCPVEYLKRDTRDPRTGLIDPLNAYSPAIEAYTDDADAGNTGLRSQSNASLHGITRQSHAQVISRIKVQRSLYCATKYTFKLPWTYHVLEPLDIVTLTDPSISGFSQIPVRITEITDRADGSRDVAAEAWPFGVAHAPAYTTQIGEGTGNNMGTVPEPSNPPILTVPPLAATKNGTPELWVATAPATDDWGGAQAWVSWDAGSSYSYAGDITAAATYGVLGAALPSGSPIDTTNTMVADVRASNGSLLSVSEADRDALVSSCWVDDEFIAYETATLAGAHVYDLTQLRRGCLGTLPQPHVQGAPFLAVNSAILRVPIDASRYGATVLVKLASYNLARTVVQDLATVPATAYQLPSPKAAAPIVTSLPFKFSFDTFEREEWDLSGSAQLSLVSGGIDGGNSLEAAGDLVAIHKSLIPVNASTLYGISATYKQLSDPSSGGKTFSVGFLGIAGDGVTPVDPSGGSTASGHLVSATKGPADGWTQIDSYWQGRADTGGGASTITAPAPMQSNVRYVRLMVQLNQATGNGIEDLDSLTLFDAAAQAALLSVGTQTFYLPSTTPPAGVFAIGSLWFRTDQNYAVFRWNGSTWDSVHDASPILTSQLTAGSITSDKLNVSQINSSGVLTIGPTQFVGSLPSTQVSGLGSLATKSSVANGDITSIDGGKITTGTIDAGRINAVNITAANAVIGGVSVANAWFSKAWMACCSLSISSGSISMYAGQGFNIGAPYFAESNTAVYIPLTNSPGNPYHFVGGAMNYCQDNGWNVKVDVVATDVLRVRCYAGNSGAQTLNAGAVNLQAGILAISAPNGSGLRIA